MAADANPEGPGPARGRADEADEAALRGYAAALADQVDAAFDGWLTSSVARLVEAWSGAVDEPTAVATARAVAEARAAVLPRVREVLATDPDEQRTTPLAVLRDAVPYAAGVLADAGVPPVVRDEHAERLFPDDDYDLVPGAFADLGPGVHDAGLAWGAAKAHVILARRRAEGRR